MPIKVPNSIKVDAIAGVYHLCGPNLHVHNVSATLTYTLDGKVHSLSLVSNATVTHGCEKAQQIVEIEVQDKFVRATLSLRCNEGEPLFQIAAKFQCLESTADIKVMSVELFQVGFEDTFLAASGREHCRFWRNWHDIWFPTGSMPLDGPQDASDIKEPRAYHCASLYTPLQKSALTLAYQLPNQWIDGIEWNEAGRLVAKNIIGAQLFSNQPIHSDCLTVVAGPNFTEALPQIYGTHIARRKVKETRDYFGWNSWEAYQTSVCEADIVENMEEIARHPWLREQIRCITIDDGWQRNHADWFANQKFPDGMDGMADKIRSRGFQAGIWTAPFFVSKKSEVFKEHPEWLLRDGDDFLTKNGETFYLDPTHPEARAFIYSLYQRLYAWGYRVYKTDFLVEASQFFVPGRPEYRENARCYDSNLGIMRGMRATMETIRAAISEDSFWLGCGTDIGCGAGLMDASRTGGDIAPFWTRVPNQARSVIHHFHFHGNLFLADPDFTLIKSTDTFHREFLDVPLVSDESYVVDAWRGGRCFDADDVRTWANLVILSGGLVNLSDRIKGLNETGLSILKTVLELAGGNAAVPLDIENSIPRVLLREEPSHYLLGLLNWDNEQTITVAATTAMGIPFPSSGVLHEVWSGEERRIENGAISLKLAPHKSQLFRWAKN